MKRQIALCLALLLCLSGCAAMLERDYTVASPHQENPPPQGDAAYRVETYPALMSALLSYVEEGMEAGVLRFPTTYAGNLTVDLEKARRQLLEEDPLGNYALSDLTYHTSKIIAYYEADLTFTYRVDPAQLSSLPRASSAGAVTALLGEALEDFQSQVTLYLTAYPEGDDRFFQTALQSAYDAHPAAAMGLPQLSAELYPATGSRRVAVVELQYPRPAATLRRQKEQTLQAAEELLSPTGEIAPTGEAAAEELFAALKGLCTYDPQGGATPYDALCRGSANQEGLALAYQLLCGQAGVDCRLERLPEGCYVSLAGPSDRLYLDLTGETFALVEEITPTGGLPAGGLPAGGVPVEASTPAGETAPAGGSGEEETDG